MIKRFLSTIPLFFSFVINAQELSQVTLTDGSSVSSISFITDQKVVIRISQEGQVLEWGMDPGLGRYNYYTGKLQPYMGRVEYYGATEYDSVLRGKVKSIGTCSLKYYGNSEIDAKKGKLRSIGSVQLDYLGYESMDNKGKLKSAGNIQFDYYPFSENESIRNKLKSVGNTILTWNSSFEDKLIRGKIKSIGSYNYTWYSSHDLRGYGGLKSGSITQLVNGVTFIVR